MCYEITLKYFRESGKYYSDEVYTTNLDQMYDIIDEIKLMRDLGKLPGVSYWDGYIYVDAEKHPNGYPVLIKP